MKKTVSILLVTLALGLLPGLGAQEDPQQTAITESIGLSMPSVDREGKPIDTHSLNGIWEFNPAPAREFWADNWKKSADIEVPGEWVMQGFEVTPDTAAGYVRRFDVPKTWVGKQVKLRFDAVFSLAVVYVNGKEVGRHEGGFTPFELDVTDAVKFGSTNTLAVAVTSESLSDILSSASQYAVHPLGGISRKVTLFATPKMNASSYHVTTEFDDAFDDATMHVSMMLNNQSDEVIDGAKLKFSLLKWPGREPVTIKVSQYELPKIAPGKTLDKSIKIAVESPDKWDNEHPNLYLLQCKIVNGSDTIQTIERRFGFRQVEIRGSEVFVNNMPVKLRAINRHEAHPLRGRSLTMKQWRADADLFREANCNLIRTSHYPPAEEFIDLCDELGLFVEEEAPLCWVGSHNDFWKEWDVKDPKFREPIVRSNLEMIERDRSHPSILFWSLANESKWSPNFFQAYQAAKKFDPTRPVAFHDQGKRSLKIENYSTDILNHHYPGPNGPKDFADYKKPVWFGEYCHLNAYVRHELLTDPGVRDAWGRGLKSMWDNMYNTPTILGGAIWSGIDDTFHLPSGLTVGYGTWGPIDGWRRPKPEYWNVKKAYSPVRITAEYLETPADGSTISIPLENRHNFTNINELVIRWQIGDEKGKATADIAPRTNGQMDIRTNIKKLPGKSVYLQFNSPLGFVVDEYRLPIGKPVKVLKVLAKKNDDKIDIKSTDNQITVKVGNLTVVFDKKKGFITEAIKNGDSILSAGPELMVLALNGKGDTQMTEKMKPVTPDTSVRAEHKVENVSLQQSDNAATITVTDSYDIAKGGYKLTIDSSGMMSIDYDYQMTADVKPRQYGMVMTFPGSFNQLHWRRKGTWTVYPDDHIARLKGVADAFVGVDLSGTAGPVSKPNYPWRHDTNKLGTNDFRSTKENVLKVYLSNSKINGPVLISDANQHVRCWLEGKKTRMLIAEYNNPGSGWYFRSHAAVEDKPLKSGDKIRGSIRFQ
jgi:beta-galactosidase